MRVLIVAFILAMSPALTAVMIGLGNEGSMRTPLSNRPTNQFSGPSFVVWFSRESHVNIWINERYFWFDLYFK